MQKKTLGKTGREISVIGFGAIKLPLISRKECEILLNKATRLSQDHLNQQRRSCPTYC